MTFPLRGGLPVLILLVLAIFSGCTGTPPSGPAGDRVFAAGEGEPFRPLPLEEGILIVEQLLAEDNDPGGRANITVSYFQGRGVTSEGKAEQWIFGITADGQDFFVQVESNRQVLVPWSAGLPEKEIDPSAIILPGDLITMNGPLIARTFDVPEKSLIVDVELVENIYALTPEDGGAYRILYFDASTGSVLN